MRVPIAGRYGSGYAPMLSQWENFRRFLRYISSVFCDISQILLSDLVLFSPHLMIPKLSRSVQQILRFCPQKIYGKIKKIITRLRSPHGECIARCLEKGRNSLKTFCKILYSSHILTYFHKFSHIFTYSYIFSHILTYV